MLRITRLVAVLVIAASVMVVVALHVAPGEARADETYVVLYKEPRVPADAGNVITRAGGALLFRYDALGIALAHSSDDDFADRLLDDQRVEGVAATSHFGVALDGGPTASLVSQTEPDGGSVDALALLAAVSRQPVRVGSLDGGLNPSNQTVASRLDAADSVSCASGVPNTSADAWTDAQGASTQRAAALLQVLDRAAPGSTDALSLAAIRVANGAGVVSPQAIICALTWAGTHGLSAAIASDLSHPLLLSCRDDPAQRTLWYAEQRALSYSRERGVVAVLAEPGPAALVSSQTPSTGDAPAKHSVDPNACVVVSPGPSVPDLSTPPPTR